MCGGERKKEKDRKSKWRRAEKRKHRGGRSAGTNVDTLPRFTEHCAVNLSVKFNRDKKTWRACFSEPPKSCKNPKPVQTKLNKLFSKWTGWNASINYDIVNAAKPMGIHRTKLKSTTITQQKYRLLWHSMKAIFTYPMSCNQINYAKLKSLLHSAHSNAIKCISPTQNALHSWMSAYFFVLLF